MHRDDFTASVLVGTPPSRETCDQLDELERVTLLVPAEGDDGETIPAGASGTIVAVWSGGRSYDVEFTEPVPGLATVSSTAVEKVCPAQV